MFFLCFSYGSHGVFVAIPWDPDPSEAGKLAVAFAELLLEIQNARSAGGGWRWAYTLW